MAITVSIIRQSQNRFTANSKEEIAMPVNLSVEEIEKRLGFDKIEPVVGLTPSEEKAFLEDMEIFTKLYEEELKVYYGKRDL